MKFLVVGNKISNSNRNCRRNKKIIDDEEAEVDLKGKY
jgi:hypothetical protein